MTRSAMLNSLSVTAYSTLIAAGSLMAVSSASAATKTWGGGNLDWTNTTAAGWNGSPPVWTDTVNINSGTVTLSTNALNVPASGGTTAVSLGGGTLEITTGKLFYTTWTSNRATVTIGSTSTLRLNSWEYDKAGGLGTLDHSAARLVVNGGIIEYAGSSSLTADRNFTVGTGGGTLKASGAGTFTLIAGGYGGITNNTGLTLDGANNGAIDNVISGTGTVTKKGVGTWTLSKANTYSGTTTVNGGTLTIASTGTINTTSGVSIGVGNFNYNSATALTKTITFTGTGGTLSGTGTINTAVNVTAGNFLATGNSIGTATFASGLTIAGTDQVELGTPNANPALGVSDRAAVTGNVTLTGGTLQLIDNAGANSNGSAGAGAYRIITYTGSRTGTFSSVTNPTSLLAQVAYNDAAKAVDVNMLNHGVASLTSPAANNTLTVNVGSFAQGSGTHNLGYAIYNLLQTAGFTGSLDLTSFGLTSADATPLSTDLATFSNLAAGGSQSANAILDANNAVGSYTETYQLNLADSAGYFGTSLPQTLTLTIEGTITAVPEPASLMLLGIGSLLVAGRRRKC